VGVGRAILALAQLACLVVVDTGEVDDARLQTAHLAAQLGQGRVQQLVIRKPGADRRRPRQAALVGEAVVLAHRARWRALDVQERVLRPGRGCGRGPAAQVAHDHELGLQRLAPLARGRGQHVFPGQDARLPAQVLTLVGHRHLDQAGVDDARQLGLAQAEAGHQLADLVALALRRFIAAGPARAVAQRIVPAPGHFAQRVVQTQRHLAATVQVDHHPGRAGLRSRSGGRGRCWHGRESGRAVGRPV
jgi:hypothetical protein